MIISECWRGVRISWRSLWLLKYMAFLLGRNTPCFLAAIAYGTPCKKVSVCSCEPGTRLFQQQPLLSAGVALSMGH